MTEHKITSELGATSFTHITPSETIDNLFQSVCRGEANAEQASAVLSAVSSNLSESLAPKCYIIDALANQRAGEQSLAMGDADAANKSLRTAALTLETAVTLFPAAQFSELTKWITEQLRPYPQFADSFLAIWQAALSTIPESKDVTVNPLDSLIKPCLPATLKSLSNTEAASSQASDSHTADGPNTNSGPIPIQIYLDLHESLDQVVRQIGLGRASDEQVAKVLKELHLEYSQLEDKFSDKSLSLTQPSIFYTELYLTEALHRMLKQDYDFANIAIDHAAQNAAQHDISSELVIAWIDDHLAHLPVIKADLLELWNARQDRLT